MGRVDGPAISGVAVNREGTGLVMVEVAEGLLTGSGGSSTGGNGG